MKTTLTNHNRFFSLYQEEDDGRDIVITIEGMPSPKFGELQPGSFVHLAGAPKYIIKVILSSGPQSASFTVRPVDWWERARRQVRVAWWKILGTFTSLNRKPMKG